MSNEHHAQNCVTLANQLYLHQASIPVDIVQIACRAGVQVRYDDLGSLAGYFMKLPKGSFIVCNHNHHNARRRFTLAHELGHFLLPGTRSKNVFEVKYYSSKERLCNQFAAALLMPESEVRLRLPLYLRQSKEETIREFARQFDVSVEAAKIRLTQLGIIQRANANDYNDLQMVYAAAQTLPEECRLIATEQLSDFVEETKLLSL